MPSKYGYKDPMKVYRATRYIQRSWRNKKANKKDKIKTAGDVKAVIRNQQPTSVFLQNTSTTLSTTPTVMQQLSRIEFSNSNDELFARKSSNIRVGHISVRARITVADDPGNLVRLMVVRLKDSDTTAAAFAPANMFQWNNGQGTQPSNYFMSDPNLRLVDVKYDKVFNLQYSSETTPATRMQDIYLNFKVPIKETWKYKSTATGTEIDTRNLKDYFVVAFSDSLAPPHPRFLATTMTWFKNISNNA